MSSPIALVGDLNPQELNQWLDAFKVQLIDEEIIAFADLTEEQKQTCEIAIVANPNPEHIAQLTNLIWLHSLWAGVEKLVASFKTKNLKIVRLVDPNLSVAMSEAVLAWSLYINRDMPHYRIAQQAAQWQSKPYKSASDTTIGVLGLGQLGQASAQRLADNGFDVVGWSRSPKQLTHIRCLSGDLGLQETLNQSDIVIVLVPLTHDTHHLLNKERLALMKPSASLINFARGAIIDTDALISQLNNNLLAHAVLDVFDQEPLPNDSPLWGNEKLTILPHISAQTNIKSASKLVSENIRQYRHSGVIPPCIDYQRGY